MYAQIISSLAQLTAVFIDGAVTGSALGAHSLAAYGYTGPVISLVTAFSGFLLTGISSVAARMAGAGDKNKTTGAFSTGMAMTGVIGGMLTILFVFFPDSLAMLAGTPENYTEEAARYLAGYGAGLIPALLVPFLIPIMQLDGDKGRIFKAYLTMAVSDILLDFLNGYVLRLGLFGMGLATAVSSCLAAAVMMLHFRKKTGMFHFRRTGVRLRYGKEIVSFGTFYIIKQLCMMAMVYVINRYLTVQYGPEMVAVYAAISASGGILFSIGTGIGSAVSVMTGVCAGEKNADALRRMMMVAVRYSILLNGSVTLLVLVFAGGLISLFFDPSGILFPAAVTGLRLYVLSTVIHSIDLSIRGYYQSMKMKGMSLLFIFLHNFACTALFMLILDHLAGINGVWLSFAAGETAALCILLILTGILRKDKSSTICSSILFIPASFENPDGLLEVSLTSAEEASDYARRLQEYCTEQGADPRTAMVTALAAEELALSLIRHGFQDGKRHHVDVRVMHGDCWSIRMRDDCPLYDPAVPDDGAPESEEHIGMRLVTKLAKEYRYRNTLGLNNLDVKI